MSIAIVGMGIRFPGARNVYEFWENIRSGKESISRFGYDELDASIPEQLKQNPLYIRARGCLGDEECFDASFFGMSPAEAALLDPQARIFIETCWHALEDAGCCPDRYHGAIGVYGGTGANTYLTANVLKNRDIIERFGEHTVHLANGPDYLTTRVAYLLDLKGPAISVYTGCSLSLVAVCLACDALENYATDMALAGGAYINCPSRSGYLYREGEICSSDGHCRPFDAGATGTLFSNGCGVVALKRAGDALSDGDRIYALIKGWGLNNDGSRKVSFTAPSIEGQHKVIRDAWAHADVPPESIGYIEAHGTGTPMGDPVEVAALARAFEGVAFKKESCAIGSVKANIGHLDAAAGVAGLMKTALILHHREIPPVVNFTELNPDIDLSKTPFYLPLHVRQWQEGASPRRAATTSLGVGGTNAHAVLEEARSSCEAETSPKKRHLLPLSAKNGPTLSRMSENLSAFIGRSSPPLPEVAFTLQTGRKQFGFRKFAVVSGHAEAVAAFASGAPARSFSGEAEAVPGDVVFMFTGQGSQYCGMAADLYAEEPVFKETIDRCMTIAVKANGCDLRDLLYPAGSGGRDSEAALARTSVTQPVLFILEYALCVLWESCGVTPRLMTGHSVGEYVAACRAGVFSLEDALRVVVERGRLMEGMPPGTMIAVQATEKTAEAFLDRDVSIAAVNGPEACVLAGPCERMNRLLPELKEKNIQYTALKTSHAFHSSMMEGAIEPFEAFVRSVGLSAPVTPFTSNVTGALITAQEATDPAYWARHLRTTVRFQDCLTTVLRGAARRLCVEVGPGNTLVSFVNGHPWKGKSVAIASVRHRSEKLNDCAFILESLGKLWLTGYDIDWKLLHKGENRLKCSLPPYPFERRRCWIEPSERAFPVPVASTETESADRTVTPVPSPMKRTDCVEEQLAGIWREYLGFETIDPDANFFELGGSSLMAASIFSKIEGLFGKKLPLAALYDASSIRSLSRLLSDADKGRDADAWSSLVSIKKGSPDHPPLFLVHGAGGNVLLYHALSRRLPEELPVYGLQSQGLDGQMPFLTTVDEMAERYVGEILAVYPEGPCLIGGYCLGGSIALEIAQRMRKKGREVALLIFLETYDFSRIRTVSRVMKCRVLSQKIEFHLRNYFGLSRHDKKIFLREKWDVARERMHLLKGYFFSNNMRRKPDPSDRSLLLNDLWRINDDASYGYVPEFYPGRVVQFLPRKEYAHHIGEALSMKKIGSEHFFTERLPVYPAGMLVEPFAAILAGKLAGHIRNALTDRLKKS